ncbi:MAG: restriction endonuclease subunit S [Rikenellaceae bacterium]
MIKQIKEIAKVRTGVYLRPAPNPTANYLQVGDFDSSGEVRCDITPSVEAQGKSQQHLLRDKDILFSAKGVKNFSTIYKSVATPSFASSSFLVITIDDNSLQSEYLSWYLNLPSTIAKLQTGAVGTSMLSISKQMIEDFEIEIPSLRVQQIVVELSVLQNREQCLLSEIADKRKQLIDNKLKKIIQNGI